MTKVTLDMNTFKALASDTRLDILRALDGKRMSLKDISKATKLNKATLHEHLAKLNEAGLVKKKERDGHKWVYYKLTWKGEGLLHPENTRIVVLFSVSFVSVFLAVVLITSFLQPITAGMAYTVGDTTYIYGVEDEINAASTEFGSHSMLDIDMDILIKGNMPDQYAQRSIPEGVDFAYLGNINATDKNVDSVTDYIQGALRYSNAIGQEYSNDEFKWVSFDGESIDQDKLLLVTYSCESWNTSPNAYNETKGENETDDNATNDTLGFGFGEDYIGTFPAIPEMIATVQDPTFLYLAAIFITAFGAIFTFSAWKFWKSRKPLL